MEGFAYLDEEVALLGEFALFELGDGVGAAAYLVGKFGLGEVGLLAEHLDLFGEGHITLKLSASSVSPQRRGACWNLCTVSTLMYIL